MMPRAASLRSWQSVDWARPVHWRDPLTRGLVFWSLSVPHRGGGTRTYDLVSGRLLTRGGMASPPTSTSGPGTTTRPGGWGEERGDGTNDYLTIPDAPVLRLDTGDWTISAWCKARVGATYGICVAKRLTYNVGTDGYLLYHYTSAILDFFSGSETYRADLALDTSDLWHHYAFTGVRGASQTTVSTYYNGTFLASGLLQNIVGGTEPLNILQRDSSTPGFSRANLDNFILYNGRALTLRDLHALIVDSRTFHPRMLRRLAVPMGRGAGGTLFTQDLGGTLATGAALPRSTTKALAGAL